jgi:hypothetical protein
MAKKRCLTCGVEMFGRRHRLRCSARCRMRASAAIPPDRWRVGQGRLFDDYARPDAKTPASMPAEQPEGA